MTHSVKKWKIFLLCFLIFLSTFYYSITLWRTHSLTLLMEKYSDIPEKDKVQQLFEFKETKKEYLQSLNCQINPAFSDPQMIDYMCGEFTRLAQRYQFYYTDILPRIVEDPKPYSPLGFFHAYGAFYSYMNLRSAISKGALIATSQLGDSCDESGRFAKMTDAISAWEAEGNTREGEWLERFLESSQYHSVSEEMLQEIDGSIYGKPIPSMAEEIMTLTFKDSLNPVEHMRDHFLCDARELAGIVFQSYEESILTGDFVEANLDAGIIETLYMEIVDAQNLAPVHYYELNSVSFLPSPYLDLAGIFILSLVCSATVAYFCRRTNS